MGKKRKIAFYTLGCRLNFSETSSISRQFPDKSFVQVDFNEKSDVYIINTCLVTEKAERKCRDIIKKTHNKFPEAHIVVVGCYSQLKPAELSEMKGVSLVLGNTEKFDIVHYLDNLNESKESVYACNIDNSEVFHSSFSMGDRTRSFLKIQDGCDYKCAYCTIPMARGKSRNSSIQSVIENAKIISENNIKEIIITGVNIGDFGKSTGESLYDLLTEMEQKIHIPRIRLSSIEPNLLTSEIIDLFASSTQLLPHFHIPLQSGNDEVLALMRRRYKRRVFEDVVAELSKKIPHASIGTDIIVAFPGETDKHFDDTYQFLEKLSLSYIHVFNYSPRKDTPAAELKGKVNSVTAKERSKFLQELSERKSKKFMSQNLGETYSVLFENRKRTGVYQGFTDNYIKVKVESENDIKNEILPVELLKLSGNDTVTGKILN